MRKKYKKLLLTSAGLVLMLIPLVGQNTNSPYSRYGYGVLSDRAIGAAKSMGGISYGLRGGSTNPSNPASYSSVDSLTFIFDIGVSYVPSRFSDGTNTQKNDNGGLDYVSMQFPIAKKLGMSIGLIPFSSVGYDFGSVQNSGGVNYQTNFSGTGGFNQVYLGVAYEPIKQLSVGANVSYLFGNTSYNRSLNVLNVTGANTETFYNKLVINALKLDFGIQYQLDLNKKNSVVIGAVFSPKVSKTGKIETIHTIASSAGTTISADTATYIGKNAEAEIANNIGLGFTWKHNNNILVGADVSYQDWSKAKYSLKMSDNMTNANRFNDSWRFNAGIEYAIAPEERGFLKKMKFRGGLNFSNSYINVLTNTGQIGKYREYGATIGLGLPVRVNSYSNRTSYINIGFEYSKLHPNLSNMVKEEYYGITLSINFNEMWFFKNKFR